MVQTNYNSFILNPTSSIKYLCCLCGLLLLCQDFWAQSISGKVYNEDNEPLSFVNVYVRETESGTATNDEGFYIITLDPGPYQLVFSAVGYETQTLDVRVGDTNTEQDIWLKPSSVELDELVIKASKRDPAYEIIQNVIDNKKKYLSQVESFKCNLYVKATEIEEGGRPKKEKAQKQKDWESEDDSPVDADPFEQAKKRREEQAAEMAKINMIEMESILNYQYPNKYKEERTAYKLYGKKAGLFVPQMGETDFNFYKNMVSLKDISEVPIVSPISRTSILSYKYKLRETLEEEGQTVYKIEVIPRKKGNATCNGFLYINKDLWNINRLDLSFYKSGLKFYDVFRLTQDYKQIEDSLWIPYRQAFYYETKQGRYTNFKGNTLLVYSDYQKDFQFPPKFFGNEIAFTSKEAYERDSTYWAELRPEALEEKQQKLVRYKDSIEVVHNSKEYKDSIQKEFNKVTVAELIYFGLGFRNNEKKTNWFVGPMLSLISFDVVGGFRTGAFVSYFRRLENGKMMRAFVYPTYGFRNKDPQGTVRAWFRYNPHKLADVNFEASRSFTNINPYDAIINQFKVSNYFLNDQFNVGHRFEIINGLYFNTQFFFANRQSIEGYNTIRIFDEEEYNTPLDFQTYQAFITDFSLSYTPKQKYMTEPKRKIVLGSRYPTFTFTHRKGWNNALSSDIDFDYLEFKIEQDLILGVFGNSKYTAKTGRFVNTQKLEFIDLKRFRESDPYLFSNALNSFQLLDTSLISRDLFFEVHHIHHFNGAIVNNIPFIKKLRLRAVAGAGFLWVKENNYRHEELMAGLERVFKLGPRRRLRVGFYGVAATSNQTPFRTDWKISLDIIDTWRKDWSY